MADEKKPKAGKAPKDDKAAKPAKILTRAQERKAKAKKEQKLVFVLHVSGNFEDPRFT